MSYTFIIDIDGTLADNSHRRGSLVYNCLVCGSVVARTQPSCTCGSFDVEPDPSSFAAFMNEEAMFMDSPQPGAREALESLRAQLNSQLVFLTGRRETTREVTEKWLDTYMGRLPGTEPVYMRSEKRANVPASEYKLTQVAKLVKDHTTSAFVFFEDDEHVFEVLKKFGIVLKAPDCWDCWNPRGPETCEPLYKL